MSKALIRLVETPQAMEILSYLRKDILDSVELELIRMEAGFVTFVEQHSKPPFPYTFNDPK